MQYLPLIHIAIIALSNILVQYPFVILDFHTTWGAFTFPMIFILTDMTVRMLGPVHARSVVLKAMIPGLIISYVVTTLFANQGLWNLLAFRVAIASFTGYLLGQLLDIVVFQKLRAKSKWWLAPTASSLLGNIIDTYAFFFLAFYKCSDAVLSAYWPEIAFVDFCFKFIISILCFVPMYGVALKYLIKKSFATN
jgi:uncharacterized integral membrane protein (TIGR00697 family)